MRSIREIRPPIRYSHVMLFSYNLSASSTYPHERIKKIKIPPKTAKSSIAFPFICNSIP